MRRALSAGILALALLGAGPAHAEEYCVANDGPGGCFPSVLLASAPAQDGDTIRIAAGTFSGATHITERLTLVGAGAGTLANPGQGGTLLTSGPGQVTLRMEQGGEVRNLAVIGGPGQGATQSEDAVWAFPQADGLSYAFHNVVFVGGGGTPADEHSGSGLQAGGSTGLASVLVTGSAISGGAATGVPDDAGPIGLNNTLVQGALEVRDSTLRGGSTPNRLFAAPGLTTSYEDVITRVFDSVAVGDTGASLNGGIATFERSELHGTRSAGLRATNGLLSGFPVSVAIADSLVTSSHAEGLGGGAVELVSYTEPQASLSARGVTAYASGSTAVGAFVVSGSNGTPTMHLANSVGQIGPSALDGAADLFAARGSITAANSVFDSSRATGGATVPAPGSGSNFALDPAFANQGTRDFTPSPGSPLVDRADPALLGGSALDLRGSARSLDGNADCVAAPDIGAIELTGYGCNPAPAVGSFGMTNRVFAPKGRGAASQKRRGGARSVERGTSFGFTLSEAATVRIRIDRRAKGRRVKRNGKRRCVRPTKKNRGKRRCTRFVRAGSLRSSEQAGLGTLPFSGRLRGRALRPGRYRATLVATDAQGAASRPRRVKFRVVRAPRR